MEPSHDVRLGWIQPQSVGSHPLFDVMDADSKAVNGYLYLADWHRHAHMNLSVVGILVDVQTTTQRSTVQTQQCTEGTAAAPVWKPAEHQTEAAACWIADH